MKLKDLHHFDALFSALIKAEIESLLFLFSTVFHSFISPPSYIPIKFSKIEEVKIFKPHNGKL